MCRCLTFVVALALALTTSLIATAQETAPAIIDDPQLPHAAHIHKGLCGNLVRESLSLPDVQVPEGDAVGEVNTTPVRYSITALERRPLAKRIDDLLVEPWSVAVHYPGYERLLGQGVELN